ANGADSPSVTPVKPRLGLFGDVYSPQHLNLTPKTKTKKLFKHLRNESLILYAPEEITEVGDKCR
ncbi:Uncharacterized protein OBRU01_04143, partial [Operophtera brumata]